MSSGFAKVRRRPEQFISDDRRVITRLFLPGDEPRLRSIIDRLLNLPEQRVETKLVEVTRNFADRHRDIESIFDESARAVFRRVAFDTELSEARRRLLGAYFTMEYAIESAALFNPSIVPHSDQSGLPRGACRFIMSLRATGEGHISSIVFRTGVVDAVGDIQFDPVSRFVGSARPDPDAVREKQTFFLKLIEMGGYNGASGDILDALPEQFSYPELEQTIERLRSRGGTGPEFCEAAEHMLWLARSNYQLTFPSACPISEVVIFPVTENESRGIEDARFVRFTDDDGGVIYYGTYTAYNGYRILPQLLHTTDFSRFRITTLNGKCVQNKGMALFPRKINGQYFMIGRLDNENLHLLKSSNIRFWNDSTILRRPQHPWEFIQIGNCGSPIETEHGWILLTHGVGAMRRYCIGAMLLDLHDPSRVLAASKEPLLSPNEKEREGYVPNVVYSCGAMLHGNELIIPYAMADSATSIATLSVDDLMEHLNG